jgi:predicted RNA-binding protein YlxR (DUF448 family)
VATKRRRQETKNNSPRRTCLGCGRTDDQAALLRVAIVDKGELEINRLAKGRGGYLHAADSCWNLFVVKKSVYRAFRKEIDRAARERLVSALRERR